MRRTRAPHEIGQFVGLVGGFAGGLVGGVVVPGLPPGKGVVGLVLGVVVLPDCPGIGVSVLFAGGALGSVGGGAVEGCLGCVPSMK